VGFIRILVRRTQPAIMSRMRRRVDIAGLAATRRIGEE